jgi:hypothetical protein
MTKRIKLPNDREGLTHKICVGKATLYVTVNCDEKGPRELFCKADEGTQPEADVIAGLASIALQGGPYEEVLERIVRFLRFRRSDPAGGPGQPLSVSDAIGRVLDEQGKEQP